MDISGTEISVLSDSGINWSLRAVWFSPGQKYYVAGSGIFEKQDLADVTWQNEPLDITSYTILGMRGADFNDIAAAGGAGEVLHFNGSTWKSYFEVTRLGYGNYSSVAIKEDQIVSVGEDVPRAIIAIGRRN